MARIYVSIVIDARTDRVWQVLEPVERHVDWMAEAVAIRFVDEQTAGAGTRFVCDTKVGPLTIADQMEITDWQPGAVMGVRHTGAVSGTGRFTLSEAVGGGTLFAWEEDLRFPWWLGGRVGARLGAALVLRPIWRANLKRLKDIVESS